MSIEVKNVSKIYGAQHALDSISFEVSPGQIMGFLGPNGAGKSTMMKIITCYLPQSMGEVKVCGFDVAKNEMEVKKRVGYLPENNPLYTDMYVKEYLLFIAGLHGLSNKKSRVSEMIELVGLQVEQKKKIGALSKGYRQRVGLAQALIHNPDVLILDEPTTGLDPNQIEEIRTLIKKIGRDKTVMMSTHIMQEVEAVCDHVIIINKGKIVANDSTSNIRSAKKSTVIIQVEFSLGVEKESLLSIDNVHSVENTGGNSWRIVANSDIRDSLFKFSVDNNNSVITLQKEEEKLEDIFKSLTK